MSRGHDRLNREWLPFAPMMRFKPEEWTGTGRQHEHYGLATMVDARLQRAWYRAQHAGRITVASADELCCVVLRRHPAEVYGETWWRFDEPRDVVA